MHITPTFVIAPIYSHLLSLQLVGPLHWLDLYINPDTAPKTLRAPARTQLTKNSGFPAAYVRGVGEEVTAQK